MVTFSKQFLQTSINKPLNIFFSHWSLGPLTFDLGHLRRSNSMIAFDQKFLFIKSGRQMILVLFCLWDNISNVLRLSRLTLMFKIQIFKCICVNDSRHQRVRLSCAKLRLSSSCLYLWLEFQEPRTMQFWLYLLSFR